jgi:hypothetical protein
MKKLRNFFEAAQAGVQRGHVWWGGNLWSERGIEERAKVSFTQSKHASIILRDSLEDCRDIVVDNKLHKVWKYCQCAAAQR